ncbi:11883_t:CDS:1, partial [Racocetra persica]
YDQQQKLIRYWGYEKARIGNGYISEEEKLARQSREYLKEIERAKYHEQRGKINCKCWSCEEQKKVRSEVEAEREKVLDDYEAEQKKSGDNEETPVKADCGNCFEYKKVDADSGLCK